jgi:hypothetical protein
MNLKEIIKTAIIFYGATIIGNSFTHYNNAIYAKKQYHNWKEISNISTMWKNYYEKEINSIVDYKILLPFEAIQEYKSMPPYVCK